MQITIDNLDVFKRFGAKIYNEFEFVKIRDIASIQNATENSLIFIDTNAVNKKTITSNTKANVVICDFETYKESKTLSICFIVTDNPKLLFARSVAYIVENTNPLDRGIHPTATIHQNAKIDDNVFIGANCTIGDCEIGENTIIHSGCNIYDGVTIGKNVMIDSGTVIGSPGFGFDFLNIWAPTANGSIRHAVLISRHSGISCNLSASTTVYSAKPPSVSMPKNFRFWQI